MTRLFPTFVAIVLLALSLAHAADTAPAPADTEATPSPTPALTAAALYDDALGHFHARDDDAARALFARIVAEFPASDETRDAIYKLGEIHYRAGQTGDAAGYYALYIDRWPAAPNARDAKTRLAMCQDSGAAAVAAPIALAETPIRHIALVADASPNGSASALHAAL
ncbi:tetratricopeptide repeat protein, partial [bacterium]|nr:tetratricopeptide repeat protein [bacterium]